MAKANESQENETKKKPNRVLPIILGVILIAGIIFGIKEYIYYGKHVDTDDAQIDGDISPVVARVGGYVDSIYFQENTHVNKDQLLVKIDDRDYKVKLEQAMSAKTGAAQGVNVGESQIFENAANSASAIARIMHAMLTWYPMGLSPASNSISQKLTWKLPRQITRQRRISTKQRLNRKAPPKTS